MSKLKVVQVGNSLGVILPKATALHLRVAKGDALNCVQTQGGVELSPFDPGFEKKMAVARRVMRRYRNALRELAK
ncbi:MAG: AbrB/MazE/SpoVT family DNA-binding domain-containing protein [Betaproteobacteria bacterium]|nr:AbrB/MazE/SpoVT family DNA-binding domain-containing protein [Betaproteobacteria bacterium]